MKAFAHLVEALSATTKTNEKISALENYFSVAADKDKVWVIALFSGRRPKRTISSTLLKTWCSEFCNIPLWLLDECYHTVAFPAEYPVAGLQSPPGACLHDGSSVLGALR